MTHKHFKERLLFLIVWLSEEIFPLRSRAWSGVVTEVRIDGQILISGDLMNPNVKIEIGQTATITLGNFKNRRGEPANIDVNSLPTIELDNPTDFEASVVEGSVSASSYKVAIRHITGNEATTGWTAKADGDEDAGEDAFFEITGTVAADSLNAIEGEVTDVAVSD